ncbi:hypothetical protein C1645_752858 [Glomus cerebriforme]|uniref:Uncharacterized protein n=1 Tax=Glomus cerebriforme TaxID=658196 RepID=A0A397TL76_9GLOM|nr:hypothetical protein C1645_752858 [Glomus cerebriforme]
MTPETLAASEDKKPLMVTEDTDIESSSSVENLNLMEQPLQIDTSSSTTNPFASFDEVFYHEKSKQSSRNKRPKHYQSVGELLWQGGRMYSDVKLTFEDRGVLATRAGIPSELRLHSLVLFQSQFFKEQLSVTSTAVPTSPGSNINKEKQIIVRLPSRVTEEDMINFYCTLKLMYTKNWDIELANNLTKGVGCLSVCCEIGFHEGIEACWKWLVRKCNRDNNKEMMKRLIEAYPNLHEQFTEFDESNSNLLYLDVPLQKSSNRTKRTPPISRRSSRRSRRRTNSNGSGNHARLSVSPILKSNRSDTSISSDSSASPRIRYEKELPHLPSISLSPSLPSPPLSNSDTPITPTISSSYDGFPSLPSTFPPSIFSNIRILNTWITNFESYAISSKRACSKIQIESRQDSKCFPFLEHFVSIFDSINQLGRAKRITSPEALDYTLRMLNVIKIEHAHFHTLHMKRQLRSPVSPKSPNNKSRPSSPRPNSSRPPLSPSSPSSSSLSSNSNNSNNNKPPIVLHESLDEPLSQIMKNVLAPIEQKHLCDYLWAPSNISNLMHLREIRSDDDDDMEEDEFEGYDQVMGEESLVKASRVSKVEHMVVGEKMAKHIREIRSNNSIL